MKTREETLEQERDEARAAVERLRDALSQCYLGEPPGDCYAAEVVEMRAEVAALREKVKWLEAWRELQEDKP